MKTIINYVSINVVDVLMTALNCYLADGNIRVARHVKDKLIRMHWNHINGLLDLEDYHGLHRACKSASRKIKQAESDVEEAFEVEAVPVDTAFDTMWEVYAKTCDSRVHTQMAGFKCLRHADPFSPLKACEFKGCSRFTSDEG